MAHRRPDERVDDLAVEGAARDRARARPHGVLRAPRARDDARDPAGGLHPHRQGQGPPLEARRRAARAAQLPHPRRHRRRALPRLPDHRLVRDRVHLRDPGDRAVLRLVGDRARLLGGDGADRAPVRDHHPREHGRGHPLRLPRPADEGREDVVAVEPRHDSPTIAREQVGVAEPIPQVGTAGAPTRREANLWRDAWHRYLRNKGALVPGAIFVLIVAWCIFWPMISPYDPNEIDFANKNASPTLAHPFGTDSFGRDLFTRAALGGRVSIGIGFAATFVILLIGVFYGSISGFVGGRLDKAMIRFLDALYGVPHLAVALITLAVFANGPFCTTG